MRGVSAVVEDHVRLPILAAADALIDAPPGNGNEGFISIENIKSLDI